MSPKVGDDYTVDLDDIMVEKKPGESVAETTLIEGLVLDKEVVHSDMPKRVEKAKIALLESALEIEKPSSTLKSTLNAQNRFNLPTRRREYAQSNGGKDSSSGANVVFVPERHRRHCQALLARKGVLAVQRSKSQI